MPSPFPGMDPYLEGYLWPDVHAALAHKIRQQLAPQIQPNYMARLSISVIEDLDLQQALTDVYDEAYYHFSINYRDEPPPPAFTSQEQARIRQRLNTN